MRAMKIGDLGFFYHSNIGKEIVGICEVIALSHPDASDTTGKWDCVDVKAVKCAAEACHAGRCEGQSGACEHVARDQHAALSAAR